MFARLLSVQKLAVGLQVVLIYCKAKLDGSLLWMYCVGGEESETGTC